MLSSITYTHLSMKDKPRWNKLMNNSVYSSYRASMDYIYSKEITGRKVDTFVFQNDGKDIAGVHYSIKSSNFGLIKTSDILSGIIFSEAINENILSYIIKHYLAWSKQKKTSYLRFSPWIPDTIGGEKNNHSNLFEIVLKLFGFEKINEGRHTYWLDLSISGTELLAGMKKDTRYRIKQGTKSEMKILRIDEHDDLVINKFWEFYKDLGASKEFNLLSERNFKYMVTALLRAGEASLFLAVYKNEYVNIAMASRNGIASYMYGAINPDFEKIESCPPPGHVTQWEMINTMKSLGLKVYDMGFCPGAVPYREHPAYDIWRFKYGFGGKHVQFMPTYGKVLNPVTGRLFQFLKYRK
ncbi:MAG: peptidoglycan bridge formation glycyltransferase FemA/FemB family protein [Bacteroidales bacterium]|nr:peptidoglycan bridge formation glycyltransferase FemA/FemB family protein [Bacteroidales bacterium]